MSREFTETHLDSETETAIIDYAEAHGISRDDAIRKMVQTGLARLAPAETPDPAERGRDQAVLEQRQLTIARRQRQIVRFQRVAVFGGAGWAVLTFATGATGPVWAALGMLAIVLMASSTYIWEYVPLFE